MADEIILRLGDNGYRLLQIYLGLSPENQARIEGILNRYRSLEERLRHMTSPSDSTPKPPLYRGLSVEILAAPLSQILLLRAVYFDARLENAIMTRDWPEIDERRLYDLTLRELFDIDAKKELRRIRRIGVKTLQHLNTRVSSFVSRYPDVSPEVERDSSDGPERYTFFKERF